MSFFYSNLHHQQQYTTPGNASSSAAGSRFKDHHQQQYAPVFVPPTLDNALKRLSSDNTDAKSKADSKRRKGDENNNTAADASSNNPQAQASANIQLDEPPTITIKDVPIEKLNPLANSPQQAPLIQGSIPRETAILTHANIHGLSAEKIERIRQLYERLDLDNDGTVNIRDLSRALRSEAQHIPSALVPNILQRISRDDSTEINFSEFMQYVLEREKKLELIFHDLDKNKDGQIDIREIKNYCNDLGIPITDAKASYIVEKMDQSGSASIDLGEFQKFMLFVPSDEPKEIVNFWRHNLIIDIGEDSQLPEEFSTSEIESGVWWRHLLAGGVAGCMSRTFTAPLDRLKVFLQVHSSKANPYTIHGAVRFLYKEGGIQSFWRGNGINVLKIAPESAFKFMAYEQVKRLIQRVKHSQELTIYERFLAGSTAGAISQSLIYPMEVLKTRLALRNTGDLDRGLMNFAREMYRKEGFICFYRGYVPNLLGIIPYAGVDLSIYETLKALHARRHAETEEPGVLVLLACGACSSTCGQCVSYPLALIRTRLQARSISNDKNQPDTMMGQLKYILRNEGPFGLYRGITPNFMKVIPAVSISYLVYESVRKKLGAKMS